jgi:FtsP/CotA-like multicopper oxidase with cupredoxin domain
MSQGKSKTGMYAAIAIIVIIIIVVGVVVAVMYKPAGSGTPLTLYAGEVSSASYGFGNSAGSIAAGPNSPTITLKEGTSYTMTVHNAGTMPHAWEITNSQLGGSVLFSSSIGNIAPGSTGSVTFTPNQVGNFYYICPIAGHAALGMWGNIVVTS